MSLRLAGVTVHYGRLAALEDITLEVAQRERLAVLGPSGSGKSTLLRAVAGLEQPSRGTLSWDGRDLAGVPPHARGFGLMFQDYALFPHRNVADNVAFGLRMRGERRAAIDRRVDEVLEMVGLAGHRDRPTTALSGGEQQRVALARALAPRPRLLMLDEPLGALDRTLRERLLGELDALFRGLGLTILYVTHDQEEALAIGDRVAILRRGRLEAVARPVELWRRPPSAWAARFLGLHNIATGTVEGDRAATVWGTLPVPAGTPGGETLLLVRPDALTIDRTGAICGIVASATFRGSRTVVRVEVEGAPSLEVHAPPALPPPAPGDSVCLAVAAEGVVVLPAAERASLSR
ncbi:MAG: ABC transporter ATP-binding protein [Chloroflexota bacterium]|nr:ABC transporter ATP-binding protein [Chloroflexota bacterium]